VKKPLVSITIIAEKRHKNKPFVAGQKAVWRVSRGFHIYSLEKQARRVLK
jgi:hypothetical protein